ncbi:MAG: CDP-alcohol phosphatidyltransferase family protein [Chloroflexota bacterium]
MTKDLETPLEQPTLTDRLRKIFEIPIEATGMFLYKLGVKPNILTFSGVLGTLIGSYFVAKGELTLGGIIIMAMGPIDFLDGAVARAMGEPEAFGAFVDSVSDRYIELIIFGSLIWYYAIDGEMAGAFLAFLAASGSVLVSYVRARAQSLGYEAKVGVLTRVERFVVIGPTIIFQIPIVGVAIVAVLANFTAFQRIFFVKRQAKGNSGKNND